MPAAGTAIQAGLGLVQTIDGFIKSAKAEKESQLLKATRPKLGRSAELDANLALTKSDLAQGMSAKAEKAYTDLTTKGLSTSLSAILKGGGDINSIGDLYGKSQEGFQKLAMIKDDLRLKQVQNEIIASEKVSERNDQQFQFNQWMPWADDAQANAKLKADAEKEKWSGLQTVGSAAMSGAQMGHESNMFAKYFKSGDITPQDTQLVHRITDAVSSAPAERVSAGSHADISQPEFTNPLDTLDETSFKNY